MRTAHVRPQGYLYRQTRFKCRRRCFSNCQRPGQPATTRHSHTSSKRANPISSARINPSRQNRSYSQSTNIDGISEEDIFDVVIVGGGPNGLALAAALRSNHSTRDLRIALLEAQDLSKTAQLPLDRREFSNRCSSLTPASLAFLDDVGSSIYMDHDRLQPYNHMSVWDGLSGQQLHFDWATASGPPSLSSLLPFAAFSATRNRGPNQPDATSRTIATMAENANITQALLQRLHELGGVRIRDKTPVEAITLGGNDANGVDLRSWPLLSLSDGSRMAARLLVGADGANSPVRRFADIQSRGWDYGAMGVVATVRLEEGVRRRDKVTAFQRFLPTGPCALLPLPGGMASLVWSTTAANASVLKRLQKEDFAAMVNAAFRLAPVDIEYMHTTDSGQRDEYGWRLQHTPVDEGAVPDQVIDVQERSVAAFPLKMRHVDTYTGERVALVGDAAHSVHPLAGQGLNSGLADVRCLAGVIASAVEQGGDIGSTIALEGYGAARYGANHAMLGAVDKLHKLYALQSAPAVAVRSWGLGVVEGWGSLKKLLMRGAGGA